MPSCISPITVRQSGEFNVVPCGRCNFCLQNRRNDWAFRLYQELKHSSSAHFGTFTYNDENVPLTKGEHGFTFMTLDKKHLQQLHLTLNQSQARTLARIRKRRSLSPSQYAELKNQWKLRYYSVGEYGSNTHRPHYHSIIFNLHPTTLYKFELGQIWNKGNIFFGGVTPASISYVTKYVIDKPQKDENRQQPFTLMSRRRGLGYQYLETSSKYHKAAGDAIEEWRMFVMFQGYKQRLPRFYKDKIFSAHDKQLYNAVALPLHLEEEAINFHHKMQELSLMYADPYEYYEKQLQHRHDQIRVKSIKLNKSFI